MKWVLSLDIMMIFGIAIALFGAINVLMCIYILFLK